MTEEMKRRTKRRYAHELYHHAAEGEVRPLEVEVPYRIARAVGFDVQGTGWLDDDVDPKMSGDRTMVMINETKLALLTVALHKGLTGDEAWAWVEHGMGDGEFWRLYESATEYGIDTYVIKPYPCGPERDQHDHLSEPHMEHGFEARTVTRVQGKESECEECTEPIGATSE